MGDKKKLFSKKIKKINFVFKKSVPLHFIRLKVMSRVRLLVFSVVVLLSIGESARAQDPHFSQFFANPLYLNPAYAGSVVCPRIVANFRHQWPVTTAKWTTYSASYDQHFNAIAGGVGVLFTGDRAGAGTINTNAFSLIYSFKADLTREVAMRIAVQATYQQKSIDYKGALLGDMIDPKSGFVYATKEPWETYIKGVADFSTGIIFYSDKFYGGLAAHHITQPNESFFYKTGKTARLPMKLSGNFGAVFDLKQHQRKEKNVGDMTISPNIIFQYQNRFSKEGSASYSYLNLGMYYSVYPMVLGAWYRNGLLREKDKNSKYAPNRPDAIVFLAGIEYEFFKVGYSYDFTLPDAKTNKMKTGGAHEISAQFHLPCPVKARRVRHINCPKF